MMTMMYLSVSSLLIFSPAYVEDALIEHTLATHVLGCHLSMISLSLHLPSDALRV
jgi:hypothetical protein